MLRYLLLINLFSSATLAAYHHETCPSGLDPFAEEPNPFVFGGWPLSPMDWEFSHPECWAHKFPTCNGPLQSPVDLSKDACPLDDSIQQASYKLVGRREVFVSKYMRAASLVGAGDDLGTLVLKDGREFEASQVYLTADSLHKDANATIAAEMLIVHKPKGIKDDSKGLLVVSILFQVGIEENALFKQLGFSDGGVAGVAKGASWIAPSHLNLQDGVQAALPGEVKTYVGSVPVPPCTENVHYIILPKKLSVTQSQVRQLQHLIEKEAGGYKKRPVQNRPVHVVCHGELHDMKPAAATCSQLPIAVGSGASVVQASPPGRVVFGYKPAQRVRVEPADASLDVIGDFGSVTLDGRLFTAKKASLRPVAQHVVDGDRHVAELVLEHVSYSLDHDMTGHEEGPSATPRASAEESHSAMGNDHAAGQSFYSASDDGNRRLYGHEEGHDAGDETHGNDKSHRSDHGNSGVHRVMVSVPLKLGEENDLLSKIGLRAPANKISIHHGHGFNLDGPIDLAPTMSALAAKDWYFYDGDQTTAGNGCSASGSKWLVTRPLEISLEQLNFLALAHSGIHSTVPVNNANTKLYKSEVPTNIFGQSFPSSTCDTPINVQNAMRGNSSDKFLPKASWKPVNKVRLQNTGHSLKIETKQMGYASIIGPNGFPKFYQITDVTLLMPSEHLLDGRHSTAELQVRHKNQKTVLELEDDDQLITSIMFDLGEESKLLKQMMPSVLPAAGQYSVLSKPVDLMWALGPVLERPFFSYSGYCNNATIKTLVFETPMTVSLDQYKRFKAAFPNLMDVTRPVQPLGDRVIMKDKVEEFEPVHYEYFLNREMGRNRPKTSPGYILFPIIGTISLCTVMMTVLFMREDKDARMSSAGGLEEVQPMMVGKMSSAE